MADALILLAVTVLVGLPLTAWAYLTDNTRATAKHTRGNR